MNQGCEWTAALCRYEFLKMDESVTTASLSATDSAKVTPNFLSYKIIAYNKEQGKMRTQETWNRIYISQKPLSQTKLY